jgi:hypothetical protein
MSDATVLAIPADRPTDRSPQLPISTEQLSEQVAMGFSALNDRMDQLFERLETLFEQTMKTHAALIRVERRLDDHGARITLVEGEIERCNGHGESTNGASAPR